MPPKCSIACYCGILKLQVIEALYIIDPQRIIASSADQALTVTEWQQLVSIMMAENTTISVILAATVVVGASACLLFHVLHVVERDANEKGRGVTPCQQTLRYSSVFESDHIVLMFH